MKPEILRRVDRLSRLTADGSFGAAFAEGADRYASLPEGLPRLEEFVRDFYGACPEEDQVIREMGHTMCLATVTTYRKARRVAPDVADAFLAALFDDFPDTTGTHLLPRFEALVEAVATFKAHGRDSYLAAWNGSKGLALASNEFMAGLLGFLLVTCRAAEGRSYSVNVFANDYGSKLDEFRVLTKGENGRFALISRVAKPKLRNAIAHGDIWLDDTTDIVRFTNTSRRRGVETFEMPVVEFVGLASAGASIAQGYMLGIAVCLLLIDAQLIDGQTRHGQVPEHLAKLM